MPTEKGRRSDVRIWGGGSLPAFRLREPVGTNFAKATASRIAEPRAKAPWFGNPPLPTTEKGTQFRVFCSTRGGGSLPAFRLRVYVDSNFAKAAAFGGQPNHALKRRGSVIHPFPPLKKAPIFGCLFQWWEGVDSNHRRHGRQIYSLLPLAAREPSLVGAGDRNRTSNLLITNQLLCQLSYTSPIAIFRYGASGRNRTTDTGIFSPLLYRLSYRGIFFMSDIATTHKIYWRFGRDSNPRPLA